ncbi:MAG: hydrogenase formation protein HypD [Elusimicrobia bacterium]|nr:hydrogenase formation protein HypD [Elusimicrobiota bacterium]
MKYLDEYADSETSGRLLKNIEAVFRKIGRPVTLMEVCGTHTMSIGRYGIRSRMPEGLGLLSGPGCPVCVTPAEYITSAVRLAEMDDTIITTFGDMLRVPNASGRSLLQFPSHKVMTVYTPLEALKTARANSHRKVVFLGTGFETTSPLVAETVRMAAGGNVKNFFCYSAHKLIPPAIRAVAGNPAAKIDGFILPGHVSVVIGTKGYGGLDIRGAVTGFEPLDILSGILDLLEMIREGRKDITNCYGRVVTAEGNVIMQNAMEDVFETADSRWRGLGELPESGLRLKGAYSRFDAEKEFGIDAESEEDIPGCRCAEVLSGLCIPPECPLFAGTCDPSNPAGACMVSSEGACRAYYKYERK